MENISETERDALGSAIDARRHDIIERWVDRVRTDLVARNVEATALVDGVEDYLSSLAELLHAGRSVETAGEQAWADIAREHAVTRVRQGFNIDQLVHEFVLLRKVLIDVMEEQHALTDPRQSDRIVDLIEAAVKVAVRSYVEHRDFQTRRTEAEHIGFVTHELRNPLSTAMLTFDQLRASLGPASQLHDRMFDLIKRSHRRLQMLIDRVLLVEQLDVGDVESRPAQTTIGEILEPVLPAIIETAHAKGLVFEACFPLDLPVYIDPLLTASAIQNLLDNAVKYTDRGRVDLDVEERTDEIVVHVRDQCMGIPEKEMSKIFEPFRRGSTHKPGSGLGLAIARKAVERQGGSIHAESAIGEGCHFWLTLPKQLH